MPVRLLTLTDAQKEMILSMEKTHAIGAIARAITGNANAKGSTIEGLTVKSFLAGLGRPPAPLPHNKPIGTPVILTEEQKKRVEELAPKAETCLELARLVMNDPTVKSMSHEYRAVWAHYQLVYPEAANVSEEMTSDIWAPPSTVAGLVGLVNDLVPNGTGRRTYGYPLKAVEDRQLKALMGYMRILRFGYQANHYKRIIDRNLFISTFIRFTHDKPDLTQEEQDEYISAAVETVTIINIERQLQDIDQAMSELMSGDREQRGQFMPMVELVNATRGKLDQSKGRLNTLIKGLVGSRENRMKERDNRSSTILHLFDAFQKSEEVRADLAAMGAAEHEEDKKETNRLVNLDDLTALIAGQKQIEAWKGS